MFLANIPSPDQGVWQIGPLSIRAYAICIMLGIVLAIWWGERRWAARGGESGTVLDIAVFAVPFGIIGGRLYHVATDYHLYFGEGRNPLDILAIWNGGLGIWGAIALGGVGAWIACRRKGIPLPMMADALAPGIILAQAIGRLGNWFNQELYGAPTDVPWGLELYQRVDPVTGLEDQLNGVAIDHTPIAVVHPTFLYELLWNLGVVLLLVWADRRFRLGHGRVFALYVAGYTLGRFWIELMRTDQATMIFGQRINVFTSALVFLGAVAYLVLVRGSREDPSVARGSAPDGDDGVGADDSGADEASDTRNPSPIGGDSAQRGDPDRRGSDSDGPAAKEDAGVGGSGAAEAGGTKD
ncbi:prolipoprotein diacylglyceryl transferase [Actinoalloteichus hymeniacidonis]|uniref:Phosphatidylglycerol--prolipoprotein diacylglyceryl transferase n=1 Tax=Actinoalloteichus hymeniacidonis TaxID=340345 RepID=A0AAC9MXZ3_9PSEU|nr:prolipoprotein diacylglyceryl transferase [Actinoalloteichus hymeniacidonis]AOS62775.1 prolipoprotein diacylglyceryl transferase [Actinoalloteichus hymeniacidonis]